MRYPKRAVQRHRRLVAAMERLFAAEHRFAAPAVVGVEVQLKPGRRDEQIGLTDRHFPIGGRFVKRHLVTFADESGPNLLGQIQARSKRPP